VVDFIPLARPGIDETDIQRAVEVLRSGMLVQGKNVDAFEKTFAEYHKVNQAIALSNGTATLHLALLAHGIGKGDEVIVPAFSYVATANVVELVGATPVFVDIDIATFNIDHQKIEEKISSRTKAIIPVHEFGLACDIEKVCQIASKNNLVVIEDAACALGAKQNGKPVGSFGHFGSFSLHPRKSITSGEGGMLITNNKELALKVRALRNHGIDSQKTEMDFTEAGYNYRMTDFQAALVIGQMERLRSVLDYKNEIASIYFAEINNPSVTLPVVPDGFNHTWQTFHVLLENTLDQKETIALLKDKNIGSNYGAQCIPSQTFYKKKYNHDVNNAFPHAYKAYTRGLALPIYDKLTKEQAHYIANTINKL
jgi:dTDP-4-amino-4,6-dideoxygalactose transaminase